MLFASREVRIGINVPEVRPWAVLKTEGIVFPNTDRPTLVNNIFIFSSNLTKFFPKEPE